MQLFGRPESLKIKFGIQQPTWMPIRYSVGEETDTLEPSASVAYGVCDMPQLAFERPGGAPIRFTPRNGDRFVIRAGKGAGFEVDVAQVGGRLSDAFTLGQPHADGEGHGRLPDRYSNRSSTYLRWLR